MDIAAVATAGLESPTTQGAAAVSVMRKALDIQAQEGAQLAQMVSQAGGVGRAMDLKA